MPTKTKLREKQSKITNTKPSIVTVLFALQNQEAKDVYVSGDFNDWSPTAARMIRQEMDGRWEKRLTLPPGRYEYKFVVDGVWLADPATQQTAFSPFGSVNSVVEVRL